MKPTTHITDDSYHDGLSPCRSPAGPRARGDDDLPRLGTDPTSERAEKIRQGLNRSPLHLCPERALLITEFFRKFDNPEEPMVVRKARALHYLLTHKQKKSYDKAKKENVP